ncbi:MAG: PAC2 family protein [Chloroflexi bacterium]|nr:PAC2 family protein [Chloroflexota bacterium]
MNIGAFEIDGPVPALRDLHVITILRPWLDAGSVGTLALGALEEHFRARPLGQLTLPGRFFDFTRYRPLVHYVEDERVMTVPNVRLSYVQRPEPPDLVFLHLLEPHANAEAYIDTLLELVKALKVRRVCRLGGMWDAIPHTRTLPVTRTTGGQRPRTARRYEGPTSIMNLFFEALEKEGIETVAFMVRLPYYIQLEEDYAGVARLMEAFGELYPLPPDLVDPARLQQQQREVEAELARNPAAATLIRQLEAEYDAQQAATSDAPPPPLPPAVERFLRELDEDPPSG